MEHQKAHNAINEQNLKSRDRRLAPKEDKVAGIPTLGPGVPCISQQIVDPQRRQTLLTQRGWNDLLADQAWEKQL